MVVRKSSFSAIGTNWSITIFSDMRSRVWSNLLKEIAERIEVFDQTYSRFRADSWITELSQKAGKYALPKDAYRLLNFYDKLYAATDELVTPLIGQTLSDAGYDAAYSFKSKALVSPAKWDEVITYDKKTITLKQPILLDFGAAGKGYLVDIINGLIEKTGATDYVVDASGDILQRSSVSKPTRVGLENPLDTSQAIGVVQLTNQSLCASAGSRRKWGNYTHIINPVTLESPREIVATWVTAVDTITADGLSTALFFSEPKNLVMFDFSYAILHSDMMLECSKDFPAEMFEATHI